MNQRYGPSGKAIVFKLELTMIKNPISTVIGILVTLFFCFMSFSFFYGLYDQRPAKEVKLRQDIWMMRRAIDFYATDKERQPKSIQELVNDGYLREIPVDPLTGSNKTWAFENGGKSSGRLTESGITDVHSGASGADVNGKPYNQY